ncbi:MAG: hypothetical protein LWY06_07820 [Firmicutes bacterium]|nr:hypothetical protein [Bacillota bacterium]
MLGTRNMSTLISVNMNIVKQLDMNSAFTDIEENAQRMKDYFFTGFAADVTQKIAEHAKTKKSGAFLIEGRPGFGKTHLTLFLSNFFRLDINDQVFRIIEEVSGKLPLRKLKEKVGRYLALNPVPIVNQEEPKFDSALITSLNSALAREAVDFIPNPTGTASEIFDETITYLREQSKYKGIVISLDSMESVIADLEKGAKSPLAEQVVKFFQYIRTLDNFPVIFIGNTSWLANNYPTFGVEEEMVETVGKYFENHFWFNYGADEWTDFVINKVLVRTSEEAMLVLSSNPEFEALADFIYSSGLYTHKGLDYIKNVLLPGCFPLHPFTLHFLPMLSQKSSKKDKNLLSFFKDTSPGSFRYFLDTFGIFQASGKLSVYTPDYLFSFYEGTIKDSTSMKNIYDAVEKAYIMSGNLPLARRVIRLAALMQIIGDETVKPIKRNIVDSLHIVQKDLVKFDPMLFEMVHKGAFQFDKTSQEISLPVEKTAINLREYLNRRLEKIRYTADLTEFLNKRYGIKDINAENYNKVFKTERKITSKFVSLENLKNPDFLKNIISSLGSVGQRYKADMMVMYLITEDDDELSEARDILISAEEMKSERLVGAIPVRPTNFLPILLEKVALEEMRDDEPPFNKAGSAERELLENYLSDINKQIQEKLGFFTRPERLYWFYRQHNIPDLQKKSPVELADMLMGENFPKFPAVDSKAVSSLKDKKAYRSLRKAAVEKLLASQTVVTLPEKAHNPVDLLIKKTLVETGIMEKVGLRHGVEDYSVISRLLDDKSKLKDIWNYLYNEIIISRGKGQKVVNMEGILAPLYKPPYGVTPSLIEMILAAIFRNHFNEIDIFKNLRVMQETNNHSDLIRIPVGYDAIHSIVTNPGDCVIYFTEFPGEEKVFVNKVIEMFARTTPAYSEAPLWQEGKDALIRWYESLPLMTKRNRSFEGRNVLELIDLLENEEKDRPAKMFFRELLPVTMGFNLIDFSFKEHALRLLEDLKSIYVEMSKYSQLKQIGLLKAVKTLFAGREGEFEPMFREWRNSIPKDLDQKTLSKDAQILLKVNKDEKLNEQFLFLVPEYMGLKPFTHWENDKTLEYLARLSKAKIEIDAHDVEAVFKVPSDKESPEQSARKIMENIFEKFSIKGSDRDVYIVDLLEKAIWTQ